MATLREHYIRGSVRIGDVITYPSGNVYRMVQHPANVEHSMWKLEVVSHRRYSAGEVVGLNTDSHDVRVTPASPIPMAHVR